MNSKPLALIGQVVAYALFALAVGYFAAAPAYAPYDERLAQIKVSFRVSGASTIECRRLTPAEIAKLPPNMRHATECPRERLPVLVEIELDGKMLYTAAVPPTGIWKDGPSKLYERFTVAPGRHTLVARLRNTRRSEGFDYERSAQIELAPRQNFVVEFRPDRGGFLFE